MKQLSLLHVWNDAQDKQQKKLERCWFKRKLRIQRTNSCFFGIWNGQEVADNKHYCFRLRWSTHDVSILELGDGVFEVKVNRW